MSEPSGNNAPKSDAQIAAEKKQRDYANSHDVAHQKRGQEQRKGMEKHPPKP